jgi:carboxylate-amine ligase
MTAPESDALAGLIVACVAQAARDVDEGVPFIDLPRRLIEENFWRAIRYGLDGDLLNLDSGASYPAAEASERLLNWCASARAELGIEVALPTLNGAQRQRRMTDTGVSLSEAYAAVVAETRDTYAASAAEMTR